MHSVNRARTAVIQMHVPEVLDPEVRHFIIRPRAMTDINTCSQDEAVLRTAIKAHFVDRLSPLTGKKEAKALQKHARRLLEYKYISTGELCAFSLALLVDLMRSWDPIGPSSGDNIVNKVRSSTGITLVLLVR